MLTRPQSDRIGGADGAMRNVAERVTGGLDQSPARMDGSWIDAKNDFTMGPAGAAL